MLGYYCLSLSKDSNLSQVRHTILQKNRYLLGQGVPTIAKGKKIIKLKYGLTCKEKSRNVFNFTLCLHTYIFNYARFLH